MMPCASVAFDTSPCTASAVPPAFLMAATTSSAPASEKKIPKSTLSHHFKALREAGLIRAERRGVEMHNTSRCPEIESRFPGLIAAIINAHKVQIESTQRAGKKRVARKG
ncbi:MAG: helix-turn-helix transcriptional regulator [Candidatus Eremiobacteraeota bacterium]|nr:helix-turn-helix transcriptional regulator [Candidatus Eremiobacteraeota bacterium]